MGNDDPEQFRKKFYARAAIFILLLALFSMGVAYWFDQASRNDAALLDQFRLQISELSKRPVACEAPREISSVEIEKAVPACRTRKEIIYVPKKEIVYVDSCKEPQAFAVPSLDSEVESQSPAPQRHKASVKEAPPPKKACVGPTLVLANREILENTTVGDSRTCEIHLSATSYVRLIGKVKLIARKITLNGTVNGNAQHGVSSNAASLDLEARESLSVSGSIDLKGAALSSDAAPEMSKRRIASVPADGGHGGTLTLKSPQMKIVGLINVGGALPPLKNGHLRIKVADWKASVILNKNILNYATFKRLAYGP